jgi:hypothetical protein
MKFPTLLISVCLIYQVYAGGPSYQPSSEVEVPPSIPLCVSCEDVWTRLAAPSSSICEPGNRNLCTVSGTIIDTNQSFSGYCAGSNQLGSLIDTSILSDIEVGCA